MEMEIGLEELRKRKIMVATPMYGGQCHGMYAKSCADLAKLCQAYDIDLKFFYLFNESLITRARNYCADEFMRSDYTHLMFIDSDIGFDPHDVLSLAAMMDPEEEDPKDIMCGPYPKKTIAWEKIKRAVDKGFADKNPQDLEKYVGDYVFNPADGSDAIRIDTPCKVLEGGTGFMMITKSAFEKFSLNYPDYTYLPDHVRTKHFDGSREIGMYFQALIDPESKRYLSEDYMFCQYMEKVGVSTYLCPWMRLVHTGSYTFGGSLADIAALGVSATADAESIKGMKK
jgi:hypothetical protein|tara:strand:+ start:16256 stop:17110 length:855 start_codon:yes stop_codon:yes gene_type:complete